MTAVWSLTGLAVAFYVLQGRHTWLFAPALGWAVQSAVSLPLLGLIGMSRGTAAATMALFLFGSVLVLRNRPLRLPLPGLVIVAAIAAALLALGPMAGVLPKVTENGVTLASPIFDHSKIAMIDEMMRSGIPPQNPFFGAAAIPDRVVYYYLWHFSAASLGLPIGLSGWEADAALTWFTFFSSVLAVAGLALRIGGNSSAAIVAVLLCATASLRTTLEWIWPEGAPALIGWQSGFGGLLFQTSWAPQHVASASSVATLCILLSKFAERPSKTLSAVAGLTAAAAFQCSAWVGGIVLALAATAIAIVLLWTLPPRQKLTFVQNSALAGALAVILSLPFAYDQISASAMRGSATLIAITPVTVFGDAIPDTLRRIADIPGFWLLYLPIEFPAFYVVGIVALCKLVPAPGDNDQQQIVMRCIMALAAVSMATAWLLASTFGDNNDLGWRAILPAAMILIAATAAMISRWPARWTGVAAVLAAAGGLLSVPDVTKILGENLQGLRRPSEQIFAATPSMWEAVRRHTAPIERVANNPLFVADMTPWPVNISWALLADRRSCYAGSELAVPFAPIPAANRAQIEKQFVRVFAGDPADGDVEAMSKVFRCDTVVVTAYDGAWHRDPFSSSAAYRLVESKAGAWRIYRKAGQ